MTFDWFMFWVAVLLGVVEGLTEFVPVSSTGHLIVTSDLLGFEGRRAEVFQIFIQLGAILAVVWNYHARLFTVASSARSSVESRRLLRNLALAFVPSAAVGLVLHDHVLSIFNSTVVAAGLIAGGLLILLMEALPLRPRTHQAEEANRFQAVGIGLAQCLALWPGFSRSAATILGGLAVGLDRRSATEFSFILAIPTMFAAAGYNMLRTYSALEPADLLWLSLSFAISFFVALGAIRWLLRYISTHSFLAFAWYRLIVGVVILLVINGS